MKDNMILNELNIYADSHASSEEVFSRIISAVRAVEAPKKRAKWQYALIPAMVIVMLVCVLPFTINREPNAPSMGIGYYDYSQLYCESVTDVGSVEDLLTVTLDGFNSQARIYKEINSGNEVIVTAKYKRIDVQGVSEIIVMREASSYSGKAISKYSNYNKTDEFINGEYESTVFRVVDGYKYVVKVQSSYPYGAEIIENIFG